MFKIDLYVDDNEICEVLSYGKNRSYQQFKSYIIQNHLSGKSPESFQLFNVEFVECDVDMLLFSDDKYICRVTRLSPSILKNDQSIKHDNAEDAFSCALSLEGNYYCSKLD